MKCYLKPSNYTCKSCLETQMAYNVAENCNECEYKKNKYEVLQFTDHGAVIMDEKGNVFRKPFEDIRILKEDK